MASNQDLNETANQVLTQLEDAWCAKLSDFKPQLLEVRSGFKKLKGKERIAGCKTWDEFCTKKLRRTKRAVNMLLAEPKPKREVSSRPAVTEEPQPPTDAEPEQAAALGPTTTAVSSEKPKPQPLSEEDELRIAKDEAVAAAIGYLSRFEGKELRSKLAEFVRELHREVCAEIEPAGITKPAATASLEPEAAEVA